MNRTTIATRKTRRTTLALLSLSLFLPAACNLNGAGGIVAEVASAQNSAVDTAPGSGYRDANPRSRGDPLDRYRLRLPT